MDFNRRQALMASDAIVTRLNTELIRVIRSRLVGQGAEVVTVTPAEQDRFFESERVRCGRLVEQAQIKAE